MLNYPQYNKNLTVMQVHSDYLKTFESGLPLLGEQMCHCILSLSDELPHIYKNKYIVSYICLL